MNIENYFKEIQKEYKVYFCKNIPISMFKNFNFLYPSLSLKDLKVPIEKYGTDKSEEFVTKMIKTAKKYHLGYEKPQYQKEMNTESFSEVEWQIYDFVKTYAYVKRYCEFLMQDKKFEYPLIAFTEKSKSTGIYLKKEQITIHPGTVRIRCAQYLYDSQGIDTPLSFIFYSNTDNTSELFNLDKPIDTVEKFLRCYGYENLDELKQDKEVLFEVNQHPFFKWLAKPNYIKQEDYLPYLLEIHYNLFGKK